MREYIHGKIDSLETARLEFQAPFVTSFALRDLHVRPGDRVLDLGSGVGAMTAQLATRFPDIALFAVDIELAPLRVAHVNYPAAVYVQADGARLPFQDETFDWVHSSWLLEHVPSPVAVLREVRRVLRPGGQCQFLEVDNSSWRTEPEYPKYSTLSVPSIRHNATVAVIPTSGGGWKRCSEGRDTRDWTLGLCPYGEMRPTRLLSTP